MERLLRIKELILEFIANPFAGGDTFESQVAILTLVGTFMFGLWTAYLAWGILSRRRKKAIKQLNVEKAEAKLQITKHKESLDKVNAELEVSNAYILEHQDAVSNLELAKAKTQAQLNSTQTELLGVRNELEALQQEKEEWSESNVTLVDSVDQLVVSDEDKKVVPITFEDRLLKMEQRINQLEAEKAELNDEVASMAGSAHHVSIDDESVIANRRKPKLEHPKSVELSTLNIPKASSRRKDNLKSINGIGPFLEEQLFALGIISYDQIARLDGNTISKITSAIEYIPGRIEKDDWVGQAQALLDARKSRATTKSFNLIMGDDLKVIEGIGPKIEDVLKKARVRDLNDLSSASVDRLKDILSEAGGRYKVANPDTWPGQAKIAVTGDWDALKQYQDTLQGGRVVSK